jgi:hypothetical protein
MAVAMTQRKLIVPKDFYRTLKLRQANNDLSDEQKEEQLARRIIDAYQRLMDNFVNYVHCHKLDESRKEYGEMSQHLRPTQLILRNMIAEHRIKPGTELGNYLYNKLNYLPTLMRSIPDFLVRVKLNFFQGILLSLLPQNLKELCKKKLILSV